MKFSVFSVALPEWSSEEAAEQLSELGYDGVAWRVVDQEESDTADFWIGNRSTWPLTGLEESLPAMKQLANRTGVEIAAFYGYPQWNDHAALERQFRAAASIDVRTVRIVGPGQKTKSGPLPQLGMASYDELLADSQRDFAWVAACAREFGVKAVTPLHHEWINSSASASRRLLDGLDPDAVGIIADFGHLVVEGWEDTLATVQILGPFLDSVMLKNFGWYPTGKRADGTVVWEYRTEGIREGRVDVPNLFAALHAEGFDGWVTIAEATKTLPLRERLADVLGYVKAADVATRGARRDEWVYEYGPGGGLWSGLRP